MKRLAGVGESKIGHTEGCHLVDSTHACFVASGRDQTDLDHNVLRESFSLSPDPPEKGWPFLTTPD